MRKYCKGLMIALPQFSAFSQLLQYMSDPYGIPSVHREFYFPFLLEIYAGGAVYFQDDEDYAQIYTIVEQAECLDQSFLDSFARLQVKLLFLGYTRNDVYRYQFDINFDNSIKLAPIYDTTPFVSKNTRIHRCNVYGFNEQKNVIHSNRQRYEFIVTADNQLGLNAEDYGILNCYYFNILQYVIADGRQLIPQYAHYSYQAGERSEFSCARDYLQQQRTYQAFVNPVQMKITLLQKRPVFKRNFHLTEAEAK